MHSMYAGYMDKAIRYSDKALVQVERLKCKLVRLPPHLRGGLDHVSWKIKAYCKWVFHVSLVGKRG